MTQFYRSEDAAKFLADLNILKTTRADAQAEFDKKVLNDDVKDFLVMKDDNVDLKALDDKATDEQKKQSAVLSKAFDRIAEHKTAMEAYKTTAEELKSKVEAAEKALKDLNKSAPKLDDDEAYKTASESKFEKKVTDFEEKEVKGEKVTAQAQFDAAKQAFDEAKERKVEAAEKAFNEGALKGHEAKVDSANAILEAAKKAVDDSNEPTLTVVAAEKATDQEKTEISELNKAIASVQSAQAIASEKKSLEDSLTTANTAFSDKFASIVEFMSTEGSDKKQVAISFEAAKTAMATLINDALKDGEKLSGDDLDKAVEAKLIESLANVQIGRVGSFFSNYNWATYGGTAAGTAGLFLLTNPALQIASAMAAALSGSKVLASYVHHVRGKIANAEKVDGRLKNAWLVTKNIVTGLFTQFQAGAIRTTGKFGAFQNYEFVNNKSFKSTLRKNSWSVDSVMLVASAVVLYFVPLAGLAQLAVATLPVFFASNTLASLPKVGKIMEVDDPTASVSLSSSNDSGKAQPVGGSQFAPSSMLVNEVNAGPQI